jgi:hypothetical protein
MLHVTNGDSVLAGFREGGIPGTYIAWRDALHDGAVPQAASLEALSDIRARRLARDDADYAAVRAAFAARDQGLARFHTHDETVLWFEHDLYDQLQLLQILDWFSRRNLEVASVSLIQIGEHPDVVPFYGLGQLGGRQLADLLPRRQPITAAQLAIGREGWTAFCAPDPTALLRLAGRSLAEMPYLAAALQRCLEEYPSRQDGLSRMERQLLQAGASGNRHRRDYYVACTQLEPWPWGDRSVYLRLDGLAAGADPALERLGPDEFALNDRGRRLLAGDDDWCSRTAPADRWVGGVELHRAPHWRWDSVRRTLVTRSSSQSDT